VLEEGKREELAVEAPVEEGAELELKLGEVGLHDPQAGAGKVDGFDVCVADASKLVGKKVKVQIERVLDGTAYATLVTGEEKVEEPITAEREAERPTRAPSRTKAAPKKEEPEAKTELAAAPKPKGPASKTTEETDEAKPKKKTRRGSRGGRGRKKKPATSTPAAAENGAGEPAQVEPAVARIHIPDPELGLEDDEPEDSAAPSGDGAGEQPQTPPKKKTRRGTRGGRNRKKKPAAAPVAATEAAADDPAPSDDSQDWGYVPMSEWADEVLPGE
jgi:predicted RNA-binding protein with TRAM domain